VIYAQTDSIFMHVPDATAVQAIDVGKQLAKLVSAAFPKPMELKFENVSWPFMLLHVNRCAENPCCRCAEPAACAACLMPLIFVLHPYSTPPACNSGTPGAHLRVQRMSPLGRGSWWSRD